MPRILVVDDDEPTCEMLAAVLSSGGHDAQQALSAEIAWQRVQSSEFDVVVTDVSMSGMDGLELCKRIHEARPDVPVLVVTGQADVATAVAALRAGAYDFLTKPIDAKLMLIAIARAAELRRLDREAKALRRALADVQKFGALIGESPVMRELDDLIVRVAGSDASVLVTGESGTGKELVARSIHEHSRRKDGPFVAVNCAAVPPTLIESELFGHVRGAFTDAKTARDGLFVQADGGTLFLDEVGELPLELQPKLLRALQERKVRPVGSESEVPFDIRIITATNRDLEYLTVEGTFREDLLYRLDVVRLELPPLRARGSDVLLLAQHFIDKMAKTRGGDSKVKGVAPEAAEKLRAYDWPGNVRELENCIERAMALARGDRIVIEDLPTKIRQFTPKQIVASANDPDEILTLDELARRYIGRVLQLLDGNKTRAAQVLGVDRRTLYRRLERHGLP